LGQLRVPYRKGTKKLSSDKGALSLIRAPLLAGRLNPRPLPFGPLRRRQFGVWVDHPPAG
jgi:hypothetical protein